MKRNLGHRGAGSQERPACNQALYLGDLCEVNQALLQKRREPMINCLPSRVSWPLHLLLLSNTGTTPWTHVLLILYPLHSNLRTLAPMALPSFALVHLTLSTGLEMDSITWKRSDFCSCRTWWMRTRLKGGRKRGWRRRGPTRCTTCDEQSPFLLDRSPMHVWIRRGFLLCSAITSSSYDRLHLHVMMYTTTTYSTILYVLLLQVGCIACLTIVLYIPHKAHRSSVMFKHQGFVEMYWCLDRIVSTVSK